jgi:uncharacterized protein Yka (UPF0111/DUF47 family)
MTLQDSLRRVSPQDEHFFTRLEEHACLCAGAAEAMALFATALADPDCCLADMRKKELQSAVLTHDIRLMLEATFVTPLDRGDIHRLVVMLDRVIGSLHAAARDIADCGKCKVCPGVHALLNLLVEATGVLKEAMPGLRSHKPALCCPIRERLTELKQRCTDIQKSEMNALAQDPFCDIKELMHQHLLLRELATVLNTCRNAGDVLENVTVKHP